MKIQQIQIPWKGKMQMDDGTIDELKAAEIRLSCLSLIASGHMTTKEMIAEAEELAAFVLHSRSVGDSEK